MKTRFIYGLAVISIPFACAVPDERTNSNTDGGTSSEATGGSDGESRGGTANSSKGGTKSKGGSANSSGGSNRLGSTNTSHTSSSTFPASTQAVGGSTNALSAGGTAAMGGSTNALGAGGINAVGGSTSVVGTGGLTTNATTGGSAGNTNHRDCSTSGDGDHNGTNDQLETQYCACKPNEAQACTDSSKQGVCSVGAKTCVVSADKTTSNWGTCITPSPGARNCNSTNDNDCQNGPDKSEAACQLCQLASPQNCGQENNKYQTHWGKGLCVAGKRQLNVTSSGCSWGECSGEVIPTSEACGPDKPDANCDGVAGDGDYGVNCLQKIHICSTPNNDQNDKTVSTLACASGQTDLALSVFPDAHGTTTTALLSCRVVDTVTGTGSASNVTKTCNYVAFGKCNTTDATATTIGYVSLSSAAGYRAIALPNKTLTCSSTKSISPAPVLADSCTNCSSTKYYAVP
jgi:hypothetical protein